MSSLLPQLPALQVVLPLLGALLAACVRRGVIAWAVAALVTWLTPVIAGALLWQVLASGQISYHLGGWPPPWGIEYRVDVLSAFVLLLVSGMVIPLDELPGPLRAVARALPSGALAEAVRGTLTDGASVPGRAWAVLLAWAVAAPVAATRLFRWE